jgi:hypothetical protein
MPEAPDVVLGSREQTHDRPTPPGDERWTKHTRILSCHFIDEASSKAATESTAPDNTTAQTVRSVEQSSLPTHTAANRWKARAFQPIPLGS